VLLYWRLQNRGKGSGTACASKQFGIAIVRVGRMASYTHEGDSIWTSGIVWFGVTDYRKPVLGPKAGR
jgi:hypothetical protein